MKFVPFALCAMGVIALSLAGCRKEEEKPAIPASSPASYMKDKTFRKELRGLRGERADLAEKLAAATNAEERAALESALKENRAKTLAKVRQRITPGRGGKDSDSPLKKGISK